jgi:hypothetical protein
MVVYTTRLRKVIARHHTARGIYGALLRHGYLSVRGMLRADDARAAIEECISNWETELSPDEDALSTAIEHALASARFLSWRATLWGSGRVRRSRPQKL